MRRVQMSRRFMRDAKGTSRRRRSCVSLDMTPKGRVKGCGHGVKQHQKCGHSMLRPYWTRAKAEATHGSSKRRGDKWRRRLATRRFRHRVGRCVAVDAALLRGSLTTAVLSRHERKGGKRLSRVAPKGVR